MRDKRLLYWALGLSAACNAYDASLLSSSQLGAPTAVKSDAAGSSSADAGAADTGDDAAGGELSAAGGAALPDEGVAGRAQAGGAGMSAAGDHAAGASGRAGAAADGGMAAAGNNADHTGSGGIAAAGAGGAGNSAGHAGSGGTAGAAGANAGAGGAADGGGCDEPDGRVWSGNGHCYFALSALDSWNVSRDGCNQRGAQLVTITSADEQAFVANMSDGTTRWIGLSKFGAPAFSWIDGEALGYTNWESGAPKVSGEVAAALRDGTQRWFDDSVSATHDALCERGSD